MAGQPSHIACAVLLSLHGDEQTSAGPEVPGAPCSTPSGEAKASGGNHPDLASHRNDAELTFAQSRTFSSPTVCRPTSTLARPVTVNVPVRFIVRAPNTAIAHRVRQSKPQPTLKTAESATKQCVPHRYLVLHAGLGRLGSQAVQWQEYQGVCRMYLIVTSRFPGGACCCEAMLRRDNGVTCGVQRDSQRAQQVCHRRI